MLLKFGVDISRLNEECRASLNICEKHWRDLKLPEHVVTSTYEGTHSAGSKHYSNNAYDLRQMPQLAYEELKRRMPKGFDVVRETDHVHIEWDPK